jgi:hypothetical protein
MIDARPIAHLRAASEDWDDAMIGQPLRRKADDRFLRGRGRFSDDDSLRGQAYAAMARPIRTPASSQSIPSPRGRCQAAAREPARYRPR